MSALFDYDKFFESKKRNILILENNLSKYFCKALANCVNIKKSYKEVMEELISYKFSNWNDNI